MPTLVWHNVLMDNAAVSRSPLMTSLRLDLERVEAGVPVATMAGFVSSSGLQFSELYDIVIPARTLKHRQAGAAHPHLRPRGPRPRRKREGAALAPQTAPPLCRTHAS
jgi:hypothetical protein